MKTLMTHLEESAAFVRSKVPFDYEHALYITLGSGFKKILEDIKPENVLSLNDIPNVSAPKVAGHGRDLIFTHIMDKPVIIQTGRIHFYEGYSIDEVVYTTRLAWKLGLKKFICTNASGSLTREITPGTLILIRDHINHTGQNALIGPGGELGERFVDMIGCYDPKWVNKINSELNLKSAVYVGLTGPTYETAAETRMLGIIGGELVGMSTVQEVIAARQLGLRVLGVSLATNFAGGLSTEVNHAEVLQTGQNAAPLVKKLFPEIIRICSEN